MAMTQKEKTDYKRAFNEQKYDRLFITVPKGKKDEYKAKAEEKGYKSLNQYIIDCIERG
jgi:DnaJ-domain-containing protein 1